MNTPRTPIASPSGPAITSPIGPAKPITVPISDSARPCIALGTMICKTLIIGALPIEKATPLSVHQTTASHSALLFDNAVKATVPHVTANASRNTRIGRLGG